MLFRSPAARLKVIDKLATSGIDVTMMFAPVIPCINDHELENAVAAGAEAGAKAAHYILLRLPLEISALFRDWLGQHYPNRAAKVMSIVQQSRRGKDYRAEFFQRFIGEGAFAELIHQRFSLARKKHNLEQREQVELDCTRFSRPGAQLGLF